jgi:hypothetical protein
MLSPVPFPSFALCLSLHLAEQTVGIPLINVTVLLTRKFRGFKRNMKQLLFWQQGKESAKEGRREFAVRDGYASGWPRFSMDLTREDFAGIYRVVPVCYGLRWLRGRNFYPPNCFFTISLTVFPSTRAPLS